MWRRWPALALPMCTVVLVGLGLACGGPGSEFEEGLLDALGRDLNRATCVRVADRDGAFHCTVSESKMFTTLTAQCRVRVVCDEEECRCGWPVEGESCGGVGTVSRFPCDGTCRQDVARGYVYDVVHESGLDLGRIEWDRDLDTDEPDDFGLSTRDGRSAYVVAVRPSSDPDVHRVVVVEFAANAWGYGPAWKPTYAPELSLDG